ncbi:hypothetical protein BCU71_24575 [Vibrio lentus]|uniref:restriction endonuclease subunit S n=1 Tax=Vibrio lentus TaxID=136468 RepID=UPI000C816DB8|nr:restriction endonuclease subunit S [Vibrio lentus]PMH25543.1 hypothetical protein BCU71_24575 [Vibrio lentus]PMK62057.1 hypothetical protein BCT93_15790 [Vibrio lentus]
MVPNGWCIGTIEDIAKVTSGGTPSRTKDSYWNGHIPWVTTSEVKFGVIADAVQKITQEGLDNSSAKLFPKDTILMAMYGQGKTRGQVAKLGIEASTNQACAALLLHKEHDVEYYYQFLTSQYENIRELANSGGQQNLSAGIIKDIRVPIPPLPEQRKIAKILSTWDKAITTTEKLIETSQQQKKALMQQLLTGKKRLVNPDTGEAFEGEWEEIAVGNFGVIYSGGTPSTSNKEYWDGDIDWITPTDITKQDNVYISSSKRRISADGLKNSSAKLVPTGSLLVCTRATIGEMAITAHEMCTNQGFKNIIPNESTNVEFVFYLLTYEKHQLVSKASGSTFLELSKRAFESMKFNVPPIGEQQKIASVLTAADKEIEVLEVKLAHFKQEKKALMQQLLTGKRRVKVDDMEIA